MPCSTVRKSFELLFTDRCNIKEYTEYKRKDGSAGFIQQEKYTDIPCRLSYDNIKRAYQTNSVSHIMQTARLFLAPDIDVRPGSTVTVLKNGKELKYKNSGIPAVYQTHIELLLEPVNIEA